MNDTKGNRCLPITSFWNTRIPHSQCYIDVTVVNVVLQVVEDKVFVIPLLDETITSPDLIKANGRGGLRVTLALLQI